MKLHLPKLLFTALITAAGIAQAKVTSIPLHTGSNNLPSVESNFYTFDTTDVELNTGDKLGAFGDNGNQLSLGQCTYDNKNGQTSVGNVTKNVKVDGTLTINGDAQVILGGQYKLTTTYPFVGTKTKNDEYTGIIANKVVVNGTGSGTHLSSWNANIGVLEVNSGNVNLHTGITSGNSYFVYDSPNGSKQVRIKTMIDINGGSTTIGAAHSTAKNEDEEHTGTSFGHLEFENLRIVDLLAGKYAADDATIKKAWIYISEDQEGIESSLTVRGKSSSVGGLNVNQTGGTASISTDAVHILSDYGDSTIIQSGDSVDTTLSIGKIVAHNNNYNKIVEVLGENGVIYDETAGTLENAKKSVEINPSISVQQSGLGTINLNGIDFRNQNTEADSTEKSTITQSGGGDINLEGTYSGVTFDIEQIENGGNIAVNGDLATDIVAQDDAGNIEVAERATLTANNVYAGTVTKTVEGDVTSYSGSVEISGASLSAGKLSTDGDTVTNTGALKADQIVVTSGKFVNEGTINYTAPAALQALGSAEDNALIALAGTTEGADVVVAGGEFVNIGNVGDVLVQEGGTLTMEAGSTSDSITMEGGQIDITGNSATGSLTINGGVINFMDGATVELTSGSAPVLGEGTTIMVTVSSDMLENLEDQEFTLFTGVDYSTELGAANVIFTDGETEKTGTIVAGSSAGSIKVENSAVVPEPTTATLSLLALAGLAMRRRRK